MFDIHQALQQAVALQQAGQFSQAASLYEQVLAADPEQADAKHLLGLIASRQGEHARAIDLIRQAVAASPTSAVFLSNLGVTYRKAGRLDEALAAYRQAIALEPSNADFHFNLGKSLKLKRQFAEAESAFRHAIDLAPNFSAPRLSMMSLYADRHELKTAYEIGREAVQNCPNTFEVYLNFGAVCRRLNALEQASECYARAVDLQPHNVDALTRLATLYMMSHRIEQGDLYLRRAEELEPESVHVLNLLGLRSKVLGDYDASARSYRRSIQKYPHFTTASSNLAGVLRQQGAITEALEHARQSLKHSSDTVANVEGLAVEGSVLVSLGRLDEAEKCFRTAIDLRGGFQDAHHNLLMCLQYQPNSTAASLLAAHRDWDRRYARELRVDRRFVAPRDAAEPLRIGFVSADLGIHPVGYFTVGLFESIDPQKIATYVYSDRIGRDPLASRIECKTTGWRDVASLPDERLAAQIVDDQIDILFDLSGHTAHNRLLVLARRVAPIQITWAGYVGTTGLSEMDYLLADRFHVPIENDSYYGEKILRMPDGYVTYSPPADTPVIGPLPAIDRGHVTLGAMCNPAKVNRAVLELWTQILRQLPTAKLLLCYSGWPDVGNRRRVVEALEAAGCANQVEFRQQGSAVELMNCYNEVDVALDTFPYSGGLTTCEAMWMGVPTITWPQERFASRHSFSHLSNVGLTDCIATSAEDYIARTIQWTSDLDQLVCLRRELRDRLLASPLCNYSKFADHFSQLMLQVWNSH